MPSLAPLPDTTPKQGGTWYRCQPSHDARTLRLVGARIVHPCHPSPISPHTCPVSHTPSMGKIASRSEAEAEISQRRLRTSPDKATLLLVPISFKLVDDEFPFAARTPFFSRLCLPAIGSSWTSASPNLARAVTTHSLLDLFQRLGDRLPSHNPFLQVSQLRRE